VYKYDKCEGLERCFLCKLHEDFYSSVVMRKSRAPIVKRPGFSNEEPESLYHRDSPWISSYHIQNSFQAVNQFILT
jgi:hypothetical protein